MMTISGMSAPIHEPQDFDIFLQRAFYGVRTVKTNKGISYFNIPCSFDIESTSFYMGEQKCSIMYEWTLGINDEIMVGRTWQEFMDVYYKLVEFAHISTDNRIIIYIHNLGYEFQFMRKRFNWIKVFALDKRKPVQTVTEDGVEFKCSYILSGYGLAKLGEQLQKYPVQKMVGDLDYSKKRHHMTPLTEKEWGYCINDVKVVMNYIREKIESDGDITKIPLTKTGYVRNYCRNSCLYDGKSHKGNSDKFKNYRKLMNSLTLTLEQYQQLKRAFQGGFTHANAFYSSRLVENVGSFDFTSSYPYVMVAEKYPMDSGVSVKRFKDNSDFMSTLNKYCCIFDAEFTGLEASTLFEHPLSSSRCFKKSGVIEDNGRVVTADSCMTTLTEQDFFIMMKFYKWNNLRITNFVKYKKGYLPTDLVKAILKLYADKTTLKGVEGKEIEYLNSKEMVNACYGMMVTDILRNDIIYDNEEWTAEKPDGDNSISKYNKGVKRFLYYPWGIWVTAYARRNLFSGIYEFAEDYVYSDTDSVKGKNIENHMNYISKYNRMVEKKLKLAMAYHKLPFELVAPKTITGKVKMLGVWEYEGTYTRFKTLGAKRYMTELDGKISITVSGVNKNNAVPYILAKYKDPFSAFEDKLHIPAVNDLNVKIFDSKGIEIINPTGKNTHTYIDERITGELTDYLGVKAKFDEYSGIHMEGADYSMSLSDMYLDYLFGIQDVKA